MEKDLKTQQFNRQIPKKHLRYIPMRDTFIVGLCEGKSVLHIGASDWPFTKQRWERGDLLYKRISEVSKKQIGIDLEVKASSYLNDKNIQNSKIIIQDMNKISKINFNPDIIVFGDTLEHLMNLETALTNLKTIMKKHTILVITVPNAFYFMNFLLALFGKEHQHPDHSVAFSYKTLTQLVAKNNMVLENVYFTSLEISKDKSLMNAKGKIMSLIVKFMTLVSPMFAETLMVTLKK
jgi:hypothetical protein